MTSANRSHRHKDQGIRAVKPLNSKRRGASGHVDIHADLCKGCELCIEACPPNVLQISMALNIMGYHPAHYLGQGCTGCGVCFYVCPEPGAITVYKQRELAQSRE